MRVFCSNKLKFSVFNQLSRYFKRNLRVVFVAVMAVVTTVPEPNIWNEICKGLSLLTFVVE